MRINRSINALLLSIAVSFAVIPPAANANIILKGYYSGMTKDEFVEASITNGLECIFNFPPLEEIKRKIAFEICFAEDTDLSPFISIATFAFSVTLENQPDESITKIQAWLDDRPEPWSEGIDIKEVKKAFTLSQNPRRSELVRELFEGYAEVLERRIFPKLAFYVSGEREDETASIFLSCAVISSCSYSDLDLTVSISKEFGLGFPQTRNFARSSKDIEMFLSSQVRLIANIAVEKGTIAPLSADDIEAIGILASFGRSLLHNLGVIPNESLCLTDERSEVCVASQTLSDQMNPYSALPKSVEEMRAYTEFMSILTNTIPIVFLRSHQGLDLR